MEDGGSVSVVGGRVGVGGEHGEGETVGVDGGKRGKCAVGWEVEACRCACVVVLNDKIAIRGKLLMKGGGVGSVPSWCGEVQFVGQTRRTINRLAETRSPWRNTNWSGA